MSFGSNLFLAEAPALGRVSNVVINLSFEVNLDLESGINIDSGSLSCGAVALCFANPFLLSAVGWVVV